MSTQLLMCPPDYYTVSYVINPWMENQINKVDIKIATYQWQCLYQSLNKFSGIQLLTPQKKLPDLVFTANAGLVKDRKVILSNFYYPERQAEESFYKAWFEQNHYKEITLPKQVFFEGEGDALFSTDKKFLWMGYGFRSDISAAPYLEKHLNLPVIPLKLIHEHFYHLDTCFCPLPDNYLLFFPQAFSQESLDIINQYIPKEKQIAASGEDAMNFACNALWLKHNDQTQLIINEISDDLFITLKNLGYEIIKIPTSEFIKAGGSIKCLVLKLSQ